MSAEHLPANGTNNALVFASMLKECRRFLVFIGFRYGINRKSRAVGRGIGRDAAVMYVVHFDEV